jgi:methionyl-tRNA formyltransferase
VVSAVGGPGLKVLFFGTPAFAVPTLDAVLASRHTIVGVVTQPDRPRGRGQRESDAPVKARARAAGIEVLQPTTLKDPAALEAMRAVHADIGVVAAYGKILTEAVLAIPPMGLINVHASLLPRYRGAAPVHRAVMNGEPKTGVTIMRVVRALDAGAMLAIGERPIGPDDTSDEVERDLAQLGARLLVETPDRLAEGPVEEVPQDDSLATYAHRLTREDGAIDWTRPAEAIHNQLRGLHPWPHAYSHLDGQRLILLRSAWFADDVDAKHDAPAVAGAPAAVSADDVRAEPGTIVSAHGDRLWIATGRGTLAISELQAEGRRPARTREFLAGRRLMPGQRFTPHP